MADAVLSFEEFGLCGIRDKFSSSTGTVESTEESNGGKQNRPIFGFFREDSPDQGHGQQSFSEYGLFNDFRYDSPPLQACLEEIEKLSVNPSEVEEANKPKKVKNPSPIPLSSLKLLKSYGSGVKRLREEKMIEPRDSTKVAIRELSTEDVFRVAGARFIQSSSQIVDALNHPFGLYFSGLTDDETRDVELAELLLSAAEKVGYGQYECANRLLSQCDYLSSNNQNPVQRVVYYFSEALREKIDRGTGRITNKGLAKRLSYDMGKVLMTPNAIVLACHGGMPFGQVMQFTGIQAIVDNVGDATKVHIIDFAIKFGIQWTVLMQALVARDKSPVRLLKITTIGTTSKELIEATGRRLSSFAQSMNLPFAFNVVMVSEMVDLKEELFDIDAEEAVVVSAHLVLRTMLGEQHQLESLMRLFRSINPQIVVVSEVEANHNSPVFVTRFIEALFYFSAYFDCLEACMERDDPNRMIIESIYFGLGIGNIVAAEGEERSIRSVKIDVWRAFFRRFGMVEKELSMSSLYQANLMVEKFACGKCCTLDLNGKSLIIGWKGTPCHSVSVWNFL